MLRVVFLALFVSALASISPGSASEIKMATGKVKSATADNVTIATKNDGKAEDVVFQISETTLFFHVVDEKFLPDNPERPFYCFFANVTRSDSSILGPDVPITIYYRDDERTAIAIRDQGVVISSQVGGSFVVFEDPKYPDCPVPLQAIGLSLHTHPKDPVMEVLGKN